MRLIDADAINKYLKENKMKRIMLIDTSPTVDAVPVVHAHWEVFNEDENAYECSNCHDAFILLEGKPEENNYQFCPNCGAKMDGGKDGKEPTD
jgi:DNA-directed RNA polymerase subunit RPC12/RpoP